MLETVKFSSFSPAALPNLHRESSIAKKCLPIKQEIGGKDMKKFGISVGLIVVLTLGYLGYSIYQKNQADEKITHYLVEQGLPEEQIITISEIRYDEKPGVYKQYSKRITTKKDTEKWRQEVIKAGVFLSGEKLQNKESLTTENCELAYYCVLDLKNNRVTVQYVISGDGTTDSQKINAQFAYPLLGK